MKHLSYDLRKKVNIISKRPETVCNTLYYCVKIRQTFLNILCMCTCAYMYIYYTTLLKSVQITRKTSTNIQRYSDSWLFVHLVICIVGNRFDKRRVQKTNSNLTRRLLRRSLRLPRRKSAQGGLSSKK